MLVWPCDIIIAADDAEFADNTVAMGVSGAEFFNHPWELGIRKAKEMLFTSRFVSAAEALDAGMVNHVVPLDALSDYTLEFAPSSLASLCSRCGSPRKRSTPHRMPRGVSMRNKRRSPFISSATATTCKSTARSSMPRSLEPSGRRRRCPTFPGRHPR